MTSTAIVLSPGDTVEFIGDSITDCDRREDSSSGLGYGYVRLIHDQLRDQLRPIGVQLINRGISGDRTRDLLARWQQDCLDIRPDVLTILIGINDTWRRYDGNDATSTEQFEHNYRSLLTAARDKLDARIVLAEPFLLPVDTEQRRWRADLNPKIAVVRSLAGEFGAVLLPLDSVFRRAGELYGNSALADDGVHPTARGHELIAKAWLDLAGLDPVS